MDDDEEVTEPDAPGAWLARCVEVRALKPEERADFTECIRFCQAEPLPTTDAETEQRLQAARERWPHIMQLLGAWGAQP